MKIKLTTCPVRGGHLAPESDLVGLGDKQWGLFRYLLYAGGLYGGARFDSDQVLFRGGRIDRRGIFKSK